MTCYRVTMTVELEADNPLEAAMRAFSLTNDITPDTFDVLDENSSSTQVVLTKEQQEEALKRAFEGTLFPTA